MDTVIPPDKKSGHIIQKYHFKVLYHGASKEENETVSSSENIHPHSFPELEETQEDQEEKEREISSPEESPELLPEQDEVMEQMLKKADELSTNLVKMQMQLEKQQEEFEKRLETEKERVFEEGVEKGRELCSRELEHQIEELRSRLTATISALEESQKMFLNKVDTIEEELIETALDLARQVIAKEVQNDSKEVALRLARLLLTEVKEAAKIKLKVNPGDFDYLKEHLETTKNVKIVSDPAVGPGGIVILSDIGNIDGEIMHRFERIKEAVFGTVK